MRCIFCKQNSETSKTIEHIIPESLGNIQNILPRGIVCDNCNNYFGLKVEKPLLDSEYFRQARYRNYIYNKKERIPTLHAILLPGVIPIEIMRDKEGISIFSANESENSKFIKVISIVQGCQIIVPIIEKPNELLMSRFLAKVALEVLASRLLSGSELLREMIENEELEELRRYARFGNPSQSWPYHMHRLYPEGKLFIEGIENFETLHEYNLLYTDSCELYLILIIFGIEYVMNMGGPEIDGYLDWLKQHSYKSPLYMDQ